MCSSPCSLPRVFVHAALSMSVACVGCSGTTASTADTVQVIESPIAQTDSSGSGDNVVHTDMQHVNMHIEPGIVLGINRLRGSVVPTHVGGVPALDDKRSMIIVIRSADIVVDTTSLQTLLNRHVFGYKGSPLKRLHVGISGAEMALTGVMHKGIDLPFRIRATASLTESGQIRIHPIAVSVLGLGVNRLTKTLGGLGSLIHIEPGHGARIDNDDFILDVETMLPPPRIRGRLRSVEIVPSGMRQSFGTRGDSVTKPVGRTGSTAKNFMYFHGGTLAFGKLTMRMTDLEIVDQDESNPFDYDLDRYQEHLVQGGSATTMNDGLIVHMPDISRLKPRAPGESSAMPPAITSPMTPRRTTP